VPTPFEPFEACPVIPYEDLATLRAHEPVAPTPSGGWFLALQDDVLAATKDLDGFIANFREPGVVVADEEKLISEIPEPRHGWMRRVINSVIAPHAIASAEPYIRDLCHRLLDDVVAAGGGELISDFVAPIPGTVIAHLAGVPEDDVDQYLAWSDDVVRGDYPTKNRTDRGEGIAGGHPEFAAYIDQQIAWRRQAANPPNDFITRLLNTEIEGKRLSSTEIRSQVIFLIISGNETTRHLIGNLLATLATDRDLFLTLQADPTLIPRAVEESLRHDPPISILMRNCTADREVRGVKIPAGTKVVFGIASANRDERFYDDPDVFRVDRPDPRGHVGFGGGPHVCPGASLARMEARIALETVLEKVAAIEPEPGWQRTKVSIFWANGPDRLPARVMARSLTP
jgi:cytochrome P450